MFGDGKTNSNISFEDSLQNCYSTISGNDTTYTPTLYVETDNGCFDTYDGTTITVYPTPTAIIVHPYIYGPLGPGLYKFNGSRSYVGILPDTSDASSSLFNYIWMTAGDTLYYQNQIIEYQYQSNSEFSGGSAPILYDVCLEIIDMNSQLGCASDTCIDYGLNVEYWKTLNIPNAMSPDAGTKEGQYFLPKGRSIDNGSYKLQIFDIWGELVFESTETNALGSPTEPWDGTVGGNGGEPVPQGTYIWKIDAKFKGVSWKGVDEDEDGIGDGKKTGVIRLFR